MASPATRTRVIFALVLGVVAALYAYDTHRMFLSIGQSPDSLFLWRGTRILLAGGDPYDFATWRTMPVGETDIAAWANGCALNPARIEPSQRDEPVVRAAVARLADVAEHGLTRMAALALEPLTTVDEL